MTLKRNFGSQKIYGWTGNDDTDQQVLLTSNSNIPNYLVTLRGVKNLGQVDVLELRPNDGRQVELFERFQGSR